MGLTNVTGVAGLYRLARREVHGRVLDGKALAADIRQALKESLAASSRPSPPVPGGVGPMTIASLLVNTVQAHHRQAAARC